jgi:hypothetical protein
VQFQPALVESALPTLRTAFPPTPPQDGAPGRNGRFGHGRIVSRVRERNKTAMRWPNDGNCHKRAQRGSLRAQVTPTAFGGSFSDVLL